MQIEGVKNKIYIAVCGIPDCGKSTFIKQSIQNTTNRNVDIDSFCNEQILDRTIRSSQIFYRTNELPVDYVFLDCPGHIDEYPEEIESCISKCQMVLCIYDETRLEESQKYFNKIFDLMNKYNIKKHLNIYSHSTKKNTDLHYDAFEADATLFLSIIDSISKVLCDGIISDNKLLDISINPVETAIRVIKQALTITGNKVAMCSFGKDSLVLLKLFQLCNCFNEVKIEYPYSGFDLNGISNEFINKVRNYFDGIDIEPFNVIRDGWNFDNHTTQDMMLCKAEMLTERVKQNNYKCVFTGIRRDEEGTRAKEKFFSPRKEDGSFDCYVSQLELFGHEFNENVFDNGNITQVRVNPLLDLTESDIWYITRYFDIPFCSEYISVNGKRYRSLGDYPITTPINSDAKTIDEICEEVSTSLIPERACRAKQDKSVKYGMEKLRTKGFF